MYTNVTVSLGTKVQIVWVLMLGILPSSMKNSEVSRSQTSKYREARL